MSLSRSSRSACRMGRRIAHFTATVLLTDIQGSCRSWEADPASMRRALTLHDLVINDAVERHRGSVLTSRGEGDSVFAVFLLASQAVAAACVIQRALDEDSWPVEMRPSVRIAMHSGEVEPDCRGRVVNRCARLRSLAHGGQVVLSSVAAELARGSLPPGVGLRDLGHHRLRDLGLERVFQVVIPGLPAAFPPLRT